MPISNNINRPLSGYMWKTTLLLGTFLVTLSSPTAFASNDKVFPGAACVPEQGAVGSQIAYPYGTAQNQSTTTKTVNCVIVRDTTTNTNGATVVVRFSFSSPVSTLGTGCGLWAFDPNKVPPGAYPQGYLAYQQFPGSYTVGSTYSLTLTLNNSYAKGQYMLFCQLPSGASVNSYFLTEPD